MIAFALVMFGLGAFVGVFLGVWLKTADSERKRFGRDIAERYP